MVQVLTGQQLKAVFPNSVFARGTFAFANHLKRWRPLTSYCYRCPPNLFIQDPPLSKITVTSDDSYGRVMNWIQGFKSGGRGVSIGDITLIQDRQEDGLNYPPPTELSKISSVSAQTSFFSPENCVNLKFKQLFDPARHLHIYTLRPSQYCVMLMLII